VRTGRHVVLVRWTRPFPRTGGALRAIEMLFVAIPNGKVDGPTDRRAGGVLRIPGLHTPSPHAVAFSCQDRPTR
jgi:hypothetical protein